MNEIIHCSVIVPVDTETAFSFFVDGNHLRSWLVERAIVEPKIGGRYELFWDLDDPENDSTIGCQISAYHPSWYLGFTWKSPRKFKEFANTADPLTHVTVMVREVKTNESEIALLHTGWRDTPEWREARLWQQRAWEIAFGRLIDRIDPAMSNGGVQF